MNNSKRITVALLLGAFLSVPLITASRASAQGTSGTLPNPISSGQLMQYADRLDLSRQQRGALESMHDEYKRDFRLLREGEIAAFLEKQQSMQGGIPTRDAVEKLLDELDKVQTKIKVLDNRLFDRALPILSERQQVQIPRIRLARERDRYEVLQAQATFGRGQVDLSELVQELELSPDAFARADSIISGYERQVTSLMRKQNKALTHMQLNIVEALEERGYVDISQEEIMSDPELVQKIVSDIQAVYAELNVDLAKINADISELSKQTFRKVKAVIPDEQAMSLRDSYYLQAFQELAGIVTVGQRLRMTRAMTLDGLTDGEKEIIAAAAGEASRKTDQLLEEGVGVAEGFWTGFSPFELNQERVADYRSDISRLNTDAQAIQTETIAQLEAHLGKEKLAWVRERTAEIAASEAAEADAAGSAVGSGNTEDDDEQEDEFLYSGDQFLPSRISKRDLTRFVERLHLSDDETEVLTVAYEDYLELYQSLPEVQELIEANRTLWDFDPESGTSTPPTKEMISRAYALRRQAIEAIRTTDEAFFENVRTIAESERYPLVDRLQRNRLRRVYAGTAGGQYTLGRDNSAEASTDIGNIIFAQKLSEEEMERLDTVLADYELAAIDAFRQRLEAQLDLQELSDTWAAEIQEASSMDIAAVIELQQRYRETMVEPTARVSRTDEAIIALNRATLGRIDAILGSTEARTIRQKYSRRAFPTVYDDPASVDKHLKAARDIEDLTADQRQQLDELAAEYRPQYAELSVKMAELIGKMGRANVVGFDTEQFKQWQSKQQKLAKHRYDRNELNARAISRLKTVLTEEQIQRIGGLPEPQEDEGFSFFQ